MTTSCDALRGPVMRAYCQGRGPECHPEGPCIGRETGQEAAPKQGQSQGKILDYRKTTRECESAARLLARLGGRTRPPYVRFRDRGGCISRRLIDIRALSCMPIKAPTPLMTTKC